MVVADFIPFEMAGEGLHTGKSCHVSLDPRKPGQGILFKTPTGDIPFNHSSIDKNSIRATNLRYKNAQIKTVEHLAAAMAAFGISDALITVDGPEIPALDGCAYKWCNAFIKAGAAPTPNFVVLKKTVEISIGDSHARLSPLQTNETPHYAVELQYAEPVIGVQRCEYYPATGDFVLEIAKARTFALQGEVNKILQAGLGKGGCLENALILGENGPLNPNGAHFPNEPARHKMLDLIGDLSAMGGLPWASLNVIKPGHKLTHALIEKCYADEVFK